MSPNERGIVGESGVASGISESHEMTSGGGREESDIDAWGRGSESSWHRKMDWVKANADVLAVKNDGGDP